MESAREREPVIESKEHLWKPAPIVGREFVQREIEVRPQYSQMVRGPEHMQEPVLSSRFDQQPAIPNLTGSTLPSNVGSLPDFSNTQGSMQSSMGRAVYANIKK